MVFGPCGGVRPDSQCEVVDAPCVFDEPVAWAADEAPPVPLSGAPRVLTDFTTEPYSRAGIASIAGILRESCDAVLVGEHHNRPDFPPTLLAALLLEQGLHPWLTLACRDRNRVVLEQELVGLRALGVDAVLCVTGDARGPDVRPDVTQVFDLDGPRLTALAAGLGVPAAVPETPTAPPRHQRAIRLLQKQRAGAAIGVLNHASVAEVDTFMAAARALGVTMPVLASAVVYTDARSAAALDALPGLHLELSAVREVLDADDPIAAGIDATVAQAQRLLAIDGIVGVNVSGLASARGYEPAAEIKAEVGRRILAVAGTPSR